MSLNDIPQGAHEEEKSREEGQEDPGHQISRPEAIGSLKVREHDESDDDGKGNPEIEFPVRIELFEAVLADLDTLREAREMAGNLRIR